GDSGAQGLRRSPVEVSEGRLPVVVGDPGLHRHAVPGRGDQEGQQHRLGQGVEGAARPHHRDPDRTADDPGKGPPGQSRSALRQDRDGSEVSVPDHEAGHLRRSDEVHGLVPDPSFVFAQSVSGLTTAMFLFLIASGLSLIFGVLRVLNFAHGTFYMLGAYTAFQVVQWIGVSGGAFWLAALGAASAVALLGGLVERLLFRHLYGKEELYQLLFTYALVLILGDAARMIWGTQQKSVGRPPELTGSFTLFGATIPHYNLFIILLGPAIALAVWFVLQRT